MTKTSPKEPTMETDKVAELLPCPFCGGEARLRSIKLPMAYDCDDVCVYCSECDVDGPHILFDQSAQSADDLPELEAQAIAAWNSRLSAEARSAGRGGVGEDALREALEEIVAPIAAMQKRAADEDRRIDGMMANALARDPEYLRGIARKALEARAALSPQPTATEETAP